MTRTWLGVIAGVLWSTAAAAQPAIDAREVRLGSQPCRILSGSGSPEGVVTAPCGLYIDVTARQTYEKASGSGDTGWTLIGGLPSPGSAGTFLRSTGSAWAASTLVLPNAATQHRIPYATATNTWGENAGLAFNGTTLTANAIASTNNIALGGHLVPAQSDASDIGTADKLIRSAWISTINALVFAETTQTLFGGYSTIGHDAGSTAAAVSTSATTVDFGKTMTPGDWVLIRAHDTAGAIRAEYLLVGSNTSGTTYNVTRDLAGAHSPDPAWAAGTPFLVRGASGDGRIDLIAVDQKPRIVFARQGATYNASTTDCVVGNLNAYYGYVTDIHGLACGSESGTNVSMDATNGFRIRTASGTPVAVDSSGNASFAGTVTAAAGAIGGWSIGAATLSASSGTVGLSSTVTGGDDIRFWAGHATPSSAPFRVTEAGVLHATSGSISNSLLVGGMGGGALNADPAPADIAAWDSASASSITTVTDGPVGTTTLRSNAGVGSAPIGKERIPISAAKVYRFQARVRSGGSSNGLLYAGVSLFDSGGNQLDHLGNYPGVGTRWYYCASNITAASITSWTTYTCEFGAGTARTIPSAARTMAAQVILNSSGSAGWMEVQDIRIEEKTPGTLIVNGAITADHIAATTITAAKIATGTITATQIASGTITATQIASGTITADRLSVTSLSAITANLGTVTIASGGSLSSGATGWTTGTGYWIDNNGGTPRFRIGNPSGQRLIWDGSGIELVTAGIEIDSSDGILMGNAGSDTDWPRALRWANGSRVMGRSDVSSLHLRGPGNATINIYSGAVGLFASGSKAVWVDTDGLVPENTGQNMRLGTPSSRFYDATFNQLSGSGTVHVCADNNGTLVKC